VVAGVTRTYLATKAPHYNGRGEIADIIGISRDITDRKQAERELQLRDRAIQAVTQGILIADPDQPSNPIIHTSPQLLEATCTPTSKWRYADGWRVIESYSDSSCLEWTN
jgi:hypothetical protein